IVDAGYYLFSREAESADASARLRRLRFAANLVGRHTMSAFHPGFRTAMIAILFFATTAPAQVVYPQRAETVDVQIRYRIRAARDERVRQFLVLTQRLDDLGFKRTRKPNDEQDIIDPTAERFDGSIPSKNVFAVLNDPRVQTILFK